MKHTYQKPNQLLATGLLLLGLAGPLPALAQTFTHAQAVVPGTSAGGGNALDMVTDASGNSYLTGIFAGTVQFGPTTLTSAGGNDIYVAKYDAAGALQWATRVGGTGDDLVSGIAVDASGNLGVAGGYSGTAAFGTTTLASAGGLDMFVGELNTNGAWQWAARVAGAADELGQSVGFDTAGNLYAVGYYASASVAVTGTSTTYANPAQVSSLLVKYTSSGAWQAALRLTSTNSLFANALTIDSSNNLYLFGDFSGTATLGASSITSAGGQDAFMTRLTTALAYSWSTRMGGANDDFAPSGRALAVDASGNAYLTGRSYSLSMGFGTSSLSLINPTYNGEVYLASLNSAGVFRWVQRAGGDSQDRGEAIALDGKGNLYTTGDFSGVAAFGSTVLASAGGSDAYVAKLTTAGAWVSAVRAGGTADDGGTGVASDVTGNLYVSGLYTSPSAGFSTLALPNAGFSAGFLGRGLADLTVSTASQTSGGIYNNVTVTGAGSTTLSSFLVANGALTVQNGGTLDQNCQPITGAGSFTVAAGATLGICDPAGITTTGNTGAVQMTGTRSFSTDASYVYNGTAAQVTGNALPAQVRNLTTTNASKLTLSQGVAIAQVLAIRGSGGMVQPSAAASVTLLSDATTGTALITGGYSLFGNTTTVQRAVDGSTNPGLGYRHFAPTVYNASIGDLTTTGFTPVVNSLYNTQGATARPFPTVYFYDEGRVSNATVPGSGFDKGWVSPGDLTDPLIHLRGYTVQLPATAKLSMTGGVIDGNTGIGVYVSRTGSDADAGWAFLGNPYPSPIDWSLVKESERTGLDAAMYVFESTGPYTGSYRSYTRGIGGNPIIPMGQAFFVRVSSGQTQGLMSFRGSQRVTTFDATTSFKRTTADLRPQLALNLSGAAAHDITYLYQEEGATAGVDAEYDAVKMTNSNGLTLSQLAASTKLAINGLPTLSAATTVPLVVGVPAAGTYSLAATTLNNLPTGLDAYLRDAQTGQTVKLTAGSSYRFEVTAAQATAPVLGRFTLQFSPATPLATAPALAAELVGVYPNPAHGSFTVTVPAVAGATQVQAELLNSLGQVVRQQAAPLPATGAHLQVATTALPAGVYILRLQAGAAIRTKQVVIY